MDLFGQTGELTIGEETIQNKGSNLPKITRFNQEWIKLDSPKSAPGKFKRLPTKELKQFNFSWSSSPMDRWILYAVKFVLYVLFHALR